MTAPLTAETDRGAWLAARRKGIGASEIAAVLGISPWESPFSLYWRKVNGWEVEETANMRTGTILERAIADWGEDRIDPNDNLLFEIGHLLAHDERAWELATPDRVVRWTPDSSIAWPGKAVAVLECKWTGSWDGWGDDGTDDVPVYYRAQLQWQCDVVGVGDWYVSALGPSGFRLYQGRRDDRDIAVMVEAGRRFMRRIEVGDPPPLDDHHATLTTVKRLHPDLNDDEPAEVDERVAANYLRACRAHKLAEKAKQRYEILLRDQMGRAKRATAGGRKVATRTVSDIAERTQTVAAHRRDYLTPANAREKKP